MVKVLVVHIMVFDIKYVVLIIPMRLISYRNVLKLKKSWSRRYYKMGHTVAQLVEALRYKPEGSGFDSQWCHWNFSLT